MTSGNQTYTKLRPQQRSGNRFRTCGFTPAYTVDRPLQLGLCKMVPTCWSVAPARAGDRLCNLSGVRTGFPACPVAPACIVDRRLQPVRNTFSNLEISKPQRTSGTEPRCDVATVRNTLAKIAISKRCTPSDGERRLKPALEEETWPDSGQVAHPLRRRSPLQQAQKWRTLATFPTLHYPPAGNGLCNATGARAPPGSAYVALPSDGARPLQPTPHIVGPGPVIEPRHDTSSASPAARC